MDRDQLDKRLSSFPTAWTLLRQAHAGAGPEADAARQLLLERYSGAVRRYLAALAGGGLDVEELMQEFAVELLSGGLRSADPERGRFRHYLKATLVNLVRRHQRAKARLPRSLPGDDAGLTGASAPEDDLDARLDRSWREELLARSWAALHQARPAYYDVLRFKREHPDLPDQEAARRLGDARAKPLSPDAYRQTLHRARERFAHLLFDEVAHSIDGPTAGRVEDELRGLDLLKYCEPFLKAR